MISKIDFKDSYIYDKIINEFNNEYKKNPFSKGYIYEIESRIVGFIIYDIIYEKVEIEYIFVEKEYRNKKIATLLLQKMISSLEKGINYEITLEVRESNIKAINLYKKNGFVKVATRKKYYGNENAILMLRR